MRCDQVHFTSANLDVRRRKTAPATHPLTGRELRAVRQHNRDQQPPSPFVFVSVRGASFSPEGCPAGAACRQERRAEHRSARASVARGGRVLQTE